MFARLWPLEQAKVTLLTSLHVANPWRPTPKFRPGTQCLLPAHRVISLRRGIWSLPGHSGHWSNPHQSSSIYEYALLIRRNALSKGQVPRAVCSLCDIVRINKQARWQFSYLRCFTSALACAACRFDMRRHDAPGPLRVPSSQGLYQFAMMSHRPHQSGTDAPPSS
jgi:hypothetical protein